MSNMYGASTKKFPHLKKEGLLSWRKSDIILDWHILAMHEMHCHKSKRR